MASDIKAESAAPKATTAKSKSTKHSKTITLRLSPALLSSFPSDSSSTKSPEIKTQPSLPTSEAQSKSKDEASQSSTSDSKTASAPQEQVDEGTPTAAGAKRKSTGGPKAGTKRSAPAENDGTPKPRGRPGPKKRKVDGENGITAPGPAAHKLGPKANQGAINAGLRALDRKGKPCRKWGKKAIALKTFTGVNWNLPYWQTPKVKSSALTGDAQSETTGSSDAKPERGSSAVESEPSNAIKDNLTPEANDVAATSSPISQQPADVASAA